MRFIKGQKLQKKKEKKKKKKNNNKILVRPVRGTNYESDKIINIYNN